MQFETLTTDRLALKKITQQGINCIFETHSEAEIKAMLGLATEEEFIKEREKYEGGYTTYDRTILFFLLTLKSSGETIGRCGFHNWYAAHSKAELGYALSKDGHKGKGYMTEALAPVIAYGFNSMGLNRIEACVGPQNMPSLSLVKKYGFTQEGYLRQHFMRGDDIQDSLIFSLLKEEYSPHL